MQPQDQIQVSRIPKAKRNVAPGSATILFNLTTLDSTSNLQSIQTIDEFPPHITNRLSTTTVRIFELVYLGMK